MKVGSSAPGTSRVRSARAGAARARRPAGPHVLRCAARAAARPQRDHRRGASPRASPESRPGLGRRDRCGAPQHVAGVLAEAGAAARRPSAGVEWPPASRLDGFARGLPTDARVARVHAQRRRRPGAGRVPARARQSRRSERRQRDLSRSPATSSSSPKALRLGHGRRRLHARHPRLLVRDFASRGGAPRPRRGRRPRLAIAGVHGAAAVIARAGDPDAVIAAAATPGGMTAAAITAFEERDIADAVAMAVHAAAERAKELK